MSAGVPASDIAIMARSSLKVWMRELAPQLEKLGIPVATPPDFNQILSDRGVRTSIAVGQIAQNLGDSLAWRALLSVTPGFGPSTVAHVLDHATGGPFAARLLELHARGFEGARRREALTNLVTQIIKLATTAAEMATPDLDGGWAGWLADLVGRENFGEEALAKFLAVGEQFGVAEPVSRFVNEFEPTLRDFALGAVEGVRVMTMGMSKGLTVSTAIALGVEANNVPRYGCDVAEELRYLYVALTRATDLTIVSYANRRTGPTARLGAPQVMAQREQSPFMTSLRDVTLENGAVYVNGLAG